MVTFGGKVEMSTDRRDFLLDSCNLGGLSSGRNCRRISELLSPTRGWWLRAQKTLKSHGMELRILTRRCHCRCAVATCASTAAEFYFFLFGVPSSVSSCSCCSVPQSVANQNGSGVCVKKR